MSLLTKMLLREMALPFLFSFAALSALLLLGRMIPMLEPLLRAGIAWIEIATFMVLLLPTLWLLVLPMSVLLAVLLAFLRLSRDSEMVAMLASGVTPGRLLRPVIAVSVLAWLFSLVLSTSVLPEAKHASKTFVRELTERRLARGLPEKVFLTPLPGLTLYVDKSLEEGNRFKGIFIRDARREDAVGNVLAEEGEILSQPDHAQVALRLKNGSLHRESEDYRECDTFVFRTYSLRLSLQGEALKPKRGELGLGELLKTAADSGTSEKDRLRNMTEFHKRLALPSGTLILGIMAAPLGILFGRNSLSGGIALGLAAFLLYYLSMAFASNLADLGSVTPAVALWTPNAAFAGIAAAMVVLINRRGPLRA
jgi:lipopolysaccharide export system permease protein